MTGDTIISAIPTPVGWFATYTVGDGCDVRYLPVACWAQVATGAYPDETVEVVGLVADGSTSLVLAPDVEIGMFCGYLLDPDRRVPDPFAPVPNGITIRPVTTAGEH